jgi:SAM-dependent methyltransferase
LFDRERNNEDIKNYICENCGFVFIYPRPSESELEELYSHSEFSKTARGFVSPDAKKFRDCEKTAIIRYLEFQKLTSYANTDFCEIKGTALDVGTGTGSFVDVLVHNGWQAEGLEPDAAYAEHCEAHYNILIHKVPLEDFISSATGAKKYKLITAFNVLEHVLHPAQFLQKINDLLSDEGILYIDMPGLDQMYTNVDSFFWKPHINTFSLSSLSQTLECSGFKIMHIGYSQLGFLMAMAHKTNMNKEVIKSDKINVYLLKSIVDSAYSPLNGNSETLFIHP